MEIKGKVHYVGVNDRNKALFENLWPLPYGVSYNSYLIDDEMVALVDTVDVCYFEVYLKKIRSIIGDKPINYLIINHMEPDHSGSISLIKQYYPNIVFDKKTKEQLERDQLLSRLVVLRNALEYLKNGSPDVGL